MPQPHQPHTASGGRIPADGEAMLAELRRRMGRPPAAIKIGTVRFWINPDTFDLTHERVHVEVQTRGGVGRYDFGGRAPIHHITGYTGAAGVTGPGGMDEIERALAPGVGRRDNLVSVTFPGQMRGQIWVKINSIRRQATSARHLMTGYDMEMVQYDRKALTVALPIPSSVLAEPLPVGL